MAAPGQENVPTAMMGGVPPIGLQKPATLSIRQPVGQQNLPIGFGISKETPKQGELVLVSVLLLNYHYWCEPQRASHYMYKQIWK